MFKYELGSIVKSMYTGFEGLIFFRHESLNGTNRYNVAPMKLKEDGEPMDGMYLDEQELELISEPSDNIYNIRNRYKMQEFEIELGSIVRSMINGYTGMVISRGEHLNGCAKYFVQPMITSIVKEGYWIGEHELEIVEAPSEKIKQNSQFYKEQDVSDKPGGFSGGIR